MLERFLSLFRRSKQRSPKITVTNNNVSPRPWQYISTKQQSTTPK